MRVKLLVCAIAVCAAATPARADLFTALGDGLWYLGFRTEVRPNPFTKGFDFTSTKTFSGTETLNLGRGTLTLGSPQGRLQALSFSGGIERRPIPEINFGVSTAGQPLNYTLDIPAGLQQLTVTGQVLIDTEFSADGGGWFHRRVFIDNRATVDTDGVLGEEVNNIDFTLGPIDQTGNIYLNAIGGLSGLLGGGAGIVLGEQELAEFGEIDPAELDLSDPDQLAAYVNAALLEGLTQAALDPTVGDPIAMAVPEPATLALLGACGGLGILSRRRR